MLKGSEQALGNGGNKAMQMLFKEKMSCVLNVKCLDDRGQMGKMQTENSFSRTQWHNKN